MKEFLILFKHEMKLQFPFKRQKGKIDILGSALSFLTTILVAVLGSDAKTLGLAVGSINVNGLIIVGNPLNINARHFYFDAVWDV